MVSPFYISANEERSSRPYTGLCATLSVTPYRLFCWRAGSCRSTSAQLPHRASSLVGSRGVRSGCWRLDCSRGPHSVADSGTL